MDYLGFTIPQHIVDAAPGYDSGPRPGICGKCKRVVRRAFRIGVNDSICDEDLNDAIRTRRFIWSRMRKRDLPPRPSEALEKPYYFDAEFWSRQIK